jgi:hypothetical protein
MHAAQTFSAPAAGAYFFQMGAQECFQLFIAIVSLLSLAA